MGGETGTTYIIIGHYIEIMVWVKRLSGDFDDVSTWFERLACDFEY